jgi:hypothetical protein
MAYKFQTGAAILSGSLTREGSFQINNDAGTQVGAFNNDGVLSGALGSTAASFTCDGAVTAGSLVVGSADMDATDLEKLDGITNGTAAANKALVVDGNADIASIRNLTATGVVSAAGITLGSAVLIEAELEMLDGITAGAGQASKALVLDAQSTIASGLVSVTASSGILCGELVANGHVRAPALISTNLISGSGAGAFESLNIGGGAGLTVTNAGVVTAFNSFVIGSAALDETDMEKLDGITNGAVLANKALVASNASSIDSGLIQLTASAGIKAEKLESTAEAVVGTNLTVGALFKMPDVTAGKFLVGDGTSYQEVALSGDATLASNGAITIAAGAVENSMLADDAVGADELASNAVVNASIASNAAIDLDKLDGGSCASALTDLAQGDFLYAGDVDDSNNIKNITFSNLEDAIFGNVSGDATIAAGGAITIAATAIEGSMLNDDCISAQSNLGGVGVDDADEFLFSDGGVLKALTGANLYGWVFGKVSGDATMNAAGAITIAASAVEGSMLNNNIVSGLTDIGAALGTTDEIIVSDNGVIKRTDLSRFATMLAGPGLAAAGGQLLAQGATSTIATDTVILSEGYNYFTGSATAVCTLPSGSLGDSVTVKAGPTAAGKTITISRSGSLDTIDGGTTVVLESPYAAVTMVYVTHGDWRIV